MHLLGIDWVGINAENARKLLLSLVFISTILLASAALRGLVGLMSAGLASALQQVVTALAGYFVILRGATFTVGDRISMGGVRGDVLQLGFIQTTIPEFAQIWMRYQSRLPWGRLTNRNKSVAKINHRRHLAKSRRLL